MLRRLKTVSMMLFLMGVSTGAAFATSAKGVDDVKITQQSETATGVVKDAFGEVVGASVVVKGTTNGVITDIDGKFELQNVKKGDIIQISYIGYKTQELVWNGTPFNVLLEEDSEMLEEVVVVGFGTQKKVNLTGAVTAVGSKEIAARPVNSVTDALQGVVPGMNFTTTSGSICVYEEEAPLAVKAQTTFPAAFVKRELDDISYSTICLPFNLESLVGTPYQGASVLELESSTTNTDGDSRVFLNFKEVEFVAGKGMRAGKPYLIQLPKNKQLKEEEVFEEVTCPVLTGTNDHGGLDVPCGNGITFHGMLNPATFTTQAEIQDKLFLTADNRLVSLYGQNSFSINGLRGYFTVSGGLAKTAEFVLNLPEKVTTSIPMVSLADSLKVTKYLWNGQIYIQRGNEVYDLSGARVK